MTETPPRLRYPAVHVPGFNAEIFTLPDRALVLCRRIRRKQASRDIDAHGRGWFYLEAQVRPGQVAFRHAGRDVPSPPHLRLLVKSFSVLEWVLAPGAFELAAFCSREPLPEAIEHRFAAPVSLFSASARSFPLTHADCYRLLRSAVGIRAVDRRETASRRPRQIRQAVAARFDHPFRIGPLLRSLGISPTVGSREFKACYGIPIVNFLSQVRATDAIWALVKSAETATAIGYQEGFNDYKQFHGHMKRFLKSTPSEFRGVRRM